MDVQKAHRREKLFRSLKSEVNFYTSATRETASLLKMESYTKVCFGPGDKKVCSKWSQVIGCRFSARRPFVKDVSLLAAIAQNDAYHARMLY